MKDETNVEAPINGEGQEIMFKAAEPTRITFGETIINGRTYIPQEDITNLELAYLFELFVRAHVPIDNAVWDYDKFITDHNLDRHFVVK